jgi:hypothetical protein
MRKIQRTVACVGILLLACAAGGAAAWAEGAQEAALSVAKSFEVQSDQGTRIAVRDLRISASLASQSGSRWLGLAEASASAKLPGGLGNATPIVSIQVFKVVPEMKNGVSKGFSLVEETTFKNGLSVEIASSGQAFEKLLLYVPSQGKEPAHMMQVTPDMAGKGETTIDGFTAAVDKFDGQLIQLRFLKWPAGDPIICSF